MICRVELKSGSIEFIKELDFKLGGTKKHNTLRACLVTGEEFIDLMILHDH